MIHPATELRYINDSMGYGVFATSFIPAGTITWVRDDLDQTFSFDQVNLMSPPYRAILDKYCYVDAAGKMVLCWDLARFFNHSCEPTCLSAGYDFEIAVRDIRQGEEMTDDYGTLNLQQDFPCACSQPRCRKIIRPDDLEHLGPTWDVLVEPQFRKIPAVPQPLWVFLKEKDGVEKVLANLAPYRSIGSNYHRRA